MKPALVIGLIALGLFSQTAMANGGSERLQDFDEFAGYLNRLPKSKGLGSPWARNNVRPQLDSYLMEIVNVDCALDRFALQEEIENNHSSSVRYLITGSCDLRSLNVSPVAKGLHIVGDVDLADPDLDPANIPGLQFGPESYLWAGAEASVRLSNLVMEAEVAGGSIVLGTSAGSLALTNVGLRNSELTIAASRSGKVFVLSEADTTREEARTPAQNFLLGIALDSQIILLRGSSAVVAGGTASVQFLAREGSNISHYASSQGSDFGRYSYSLSAGSRAYVRTAGGSVSSVSLSSGSSFVYPNFAPVNPENLSVSPSSYFGVEFD